MPLSPWLVQTLRVIVTTSLSENLNVIRGLELVSKGFKVEDGLGQVTLWHVDLRLTVQKVDIDAAADLLAVSRRVEDVTDGLTLAEWVVGHLALLSVARVG